MKTSHNQRTIRGVLIDSSDKIYDKDNFYIYLYVIYEKANYYCLLMITLLMIISSSFT